MMAEGTFELHPGDALYPETVLELSDVPQTLYVRGNPEALSTPALSIIGARKASPYGLAVAELAAKVAVEAGVTVVSGGAVGCDQASGWAAVNAGGKHVVVLESFLHVQDFQTVSHYQLLIRKAYPASPDKK